MNAGTLGELPAQVPSALASPTLNSVTPIVVVTLVGLLALVMSALLSAGELAIDRLSRATAHDLVEEERRHAGILEGLLATRRRTELSLRGMRTFLQVVWAVAVMVALMATPLPWWATALIGMAVVSVVQFVLVSVLPLRIAARNPERVGLLLATRMATLVRLSHWVDPLVGWVRRWLPAPAQTEAEAREKMTTDLREMVDQVGETEGFDSDDRHMLRNVFELGNTLVREVMVPRTDMVTVDADTPGDKALHLFVKSGFSRVPVVGDDGDDIRGVLYFKDVVRRLQESLQESDDTDPPTAEQMMRAAEFVVEMKPADDLLRDMQAQHYHLALVVDEYGGISGLVTLEDLIEEVVGEVTDEHDQNVQEPEEVSPGVWRVPSRFQIAELGELLGMELEDDDVDSVGGLLGKAIGRVPLPGATGEALGVHMVAEEARGRRRQVGTILSSRVPQPDPSKENA